ncbi:MAG: NifB/NifX family molybdenum-iron cluster-binding protein [Bacteroidales bacterium]|jgi:predicted Fe-Mo cluster-binding NifX family protein|nr:NifB/NifX family molybdenum-iron cluster-binding protein [Bacteroidales bacterium]
MKYLFPAKNADWNTRLESRFGRAAGFVLYDDAKDSLAFIENPNQNEGHGVGIQAAQTAIQSGAEVVVASGPVGPKASEVLNQANVKIIADCGEITLKEALDKAKP